MSHQFQPEKAVASIGYLVRETGADLYSVMKMLYLADKLHLGRFGRTITGDVYTAMEKGPLPERAYNLCKFVQGSRQNFDPMPNAKDYLILDGYNFDLKADPDLDELSLSDIEALKDVAAIHCKGGWKAVFNESHDAPWTKAWDRAKKIGVGSIGMDLRDIAQDVGGDDLADYVLDPHPGSVQAAR